MGEKKISLLIIAVFLTGVLFGFFVSQIWHQPLIFWSVLSRDLTVLIKLTGLLGLAFLPWAVFGLTLAGVNFRFYLGLGFGGGVFLGIMVSQSPVIMALAVAFLCGVACLVFLHAVARRTKRLTGLYLDEVFGQAVKINLTVLTVLLVVLSYASLQSQNQVDLARPIYQLIRPVTTPLVKTWNRQLTNKLQAGLGEPGRQEWSPEERQAILDQIRGQVEGLVLDNPLARIIGLQPGQIDLTKVRISPAGEVDLEVLVDAFLSQLTLNLTRNTQGYRFVLDPLLSLGQLAILWPWTWLAGPVISLGLGLGIKILINLGFLTTKTEMVEVTRLSL